jgi:hypothetical protein
MGAVRDALLPSSLRLVFGGRRGDGDGGAAAGDGGVGGATTVLPGWDGALAALAAPLACLLWLWLVREVAAVCCSSSAAEGGRNRERQPPSAPPTAGRRR